MQTYNFRKIREEIHEELVSRKLYKENINNKLNIIEDISNYLKDNKKNIQGKDFTYSKFRNCKIEDMEFKECIFNGNDFYSCSLRNVNFVSCSFYELDESICIFNENTIFENCKFINCNMQKGIFENVSFYRASFIECNLKDSILNNTYIENMIVKDCDMRSLKMINLDLKSFEFEDDYSSRLDEYTFIDKIKLDKSDKKNYKAICKFYKDISAKFEVNGILSNTGEYYYIARCIEYKYLKGINKIKSAIFWLLCGYGEKPTFALITSLEVILAFAIIYMISGISVDGNMISYTNIFSQGILFENLNEDFMNSLYFSIVTFTTVGYGDITPVGFVSVFLSGVEMLLGVTMVGIWTATLARKITR